MFLTSLERESPLPKFEIIELLIIQIIIITVINYYISSFVV